MALLFIDSFDHYVSTELLVTITKKWQQGAPSTQTGAYGRNGTNGLKLIHTSGTNSFVRKTLPAPKTTVIIGAGVRFINTGGLTPQDPVVFSFVENGVTQVDVRFNQNTNLLYVTRNGTTLATGTTTLLYGVYYHIEFKATINTSTGSYTLRINELQELTASGVNTQGTAAAVVDSIQLGALQFNTFNEVDYDDLYVCDSLGGVNNDFLGDCRVQCLFPESAGATSGWTPLSGQNYTNVDDVTPDDDTTYVSTGVAGTIDTYAMNDLAATTGSVKGVQTVVSARKDDAGTRTIAPVIRIGATNYAGNNQNIMTTYSMFLQQYDVSPATAAAFTISEVNAMEAGEKLVA